MSESGGKIEKTPSGDDEKFWWEGKLFNPKTIEGEKVSEEIQYIRDLYKFASERDPRIRGIAIVGSTLKGYSIRRDTDGNVKSDIDISIIMDDKPKEGPMGTKIFDTLAEFVRSQKEFETREKNKFKIEIVGGYSTEFLTPDYIRSAQWMVIPMIFPVVGNVEDLRHRVKDALKSLSPQEKEDWISKIIYNLVNRRSTETKYLARKMVNLEDRNKYDDAREKLLRERIERMFFS